MSSARKPLPALIRRLFERLPILLLVGVALVQIALARFDALVAWKGGGFGMFSGIDGPSLREVRALGRDGARIALPDSLFESEEAARIHPSDGNLRALLRALEADASDVAAVEVWRSDFEGERLRPTRRRLARVEAPP